MPRGHAKVVLWLPGHAVLGFLSVLKSWQREHQPPSPPGQVVNRFKIVFLLGWVNQNWCKVQRLKENKIPPNTLSSERMV